MSNHIESFYPLTFRPDDAEQLSIFISRRQSVEIIGINRVGISNFLRFYLHNDGVQKKYLPSQNHLFIPVDLNDLTELNLTMFWRLTLTRIYDKTMNSPLINQSVKGKIESAMKKMNNDEKIFTIVETIRFILKNIADAQVLPTVFFIRFDRIKDIVTDTVFNNLQGLREATGHKFMFIMTSFRSIQELNPRCFPKNASLRFLPQMYLKPARKEDCMILLETFEKAHSLIINQKVKTMLIENSGGHIQYLQIQLLLYDELINKSHLNGMQLIEKITVDERINLQSEEIYGNLNQNEQKVLIRFVRTKKAIKDLGDYPYLTETGIIKKTGDGYGVFNIYFEKYLTKISSHANNNPYLAFTTKEDKLLNLLLENKGHVCERSKIEEVVWPECEEIGISDWAIDRLASRLRVKLKLNDSPVKIITIRSKGYLIPDPDKIETE